MRNISSSARLSDLIWSHMAYQIMHKKLQTILRGGYENNNQHQYVEIFLLLKAWCVFIISKYDVLYIFCALFMKYSMLLLLTVSTYKNVCGYFRLIWRCQCIKGCATIPINAHLSCALSHDSEKKYLDLYTEKEYVYF